jgi:phosphocarrier protein
MVEQEIEIINTLGLHARAAAKLVSTAARFGSVVKLEYAGQNADAKSIMSVMMLAAGKGSMITIRCDGKDEESALQALTDLINDYFGEDG